MYRALDKLGIVPPQCMSFTITCTHDQPVTVHFECLLSEEGDRAVASVIAAQREN